MRESSLPIKPAGRLLKIAMEFKRNKIACKRKEKYRKLPIPYLWEKKLTFRYQLVILMLTREGLQRDW